MEKPNSKLFLGFPPPKWQRCKSYVNHGGSYVNYPGSSKRKICVNCYVFRSNCCVFSVCMFLRPHQLEFPSKNWNFQKIYFYPSPKISFQIYSRIAAGNSGNSSISQNWNFHKLIGISRNLNF